MKVNRASEVSKSLKIQDHADWLNELLGFISSTNLFEQYGALLAIFSPNTVYSTSIYRGITLQFHVLLTEFY